MEARLSLAGTAMQRRRLRFPIPLGHRKGAVGLLLCSVLSWAVGLTSWLGKEEQASFANIRRPSRS